MLTSSPSSACYSALTYPFLSEYDDRRWSYNVISIFQSGGERRKSTFGFWFGHVSHLRSKAIVVQNFDHMIISRLRYYYFRYLKTNRRHIEILLPVSILTFSLSSACGSSSTHQISSESDHPRQSYDVMAIFKMAAISHVGFGFR